MADVLIARDDAVMSISLNRPDRLNAFSEEMLKGVKEALQDAAHDDKIAVVVFKGEGRGFCAGGDVKTMGQISADEVYEHIGLLNEVVLAMTSLEKPIIAAVHGVAAGAGFNLALASDLIIASDEARFIMSFIQVGLISDGGGLSLLPRVVSPQMAKELFFLGEPISAERAYQLGIVNRVVSVSGLEQAAQDLAEKLALRPRQAMAQMKRLIGQSHDTPLVDMLRLEQITQAVMVDTVDHREGVRAFQEKRPPQFGG